MNPSKATPSPSMGEGWGGGERLASMLKVAIGHAFHPHPNPSPVKGEGLGFHTRANFFYQDLAPCPL